MLGPASGKEGEAQTMPASQALSEPTAEAGKGDSSAGPKSKTDTNGDITVAIPANLVQWQRDFLKTAAPYLVTAYRYTEKNVVPLASQGVVHARGAWGRLSPLTQHDTSQTAAGLFLAFAGGRYPTLIAAFTAYYQHGWGPTQRALEQMYHAAKRVRQASLQDDELDLDGDGVADVVSLTKAQLVQRKLLLAAHTVDPAALGEAIGAISAGWLTVLATLRVQFAKAITLGSSIGDAVTPPALRLLQPVVRAAVALHRKTEDVLDSSRSNSSASSHRTLTLAPEVVDQWSKRGITWMVKFGAVSFAWFLQRMLSAVHSAVKGGQLAGRGIVALLHRSKMVSATADESYLDETLGALVCVVGLLYQIRTRFNGSLPFPLNLVCLPVDAAEALLMMVTASRLKVKRGW